MKNLKKKFRFRIHLKSKHLLVIMTFFCGSAVVATLASGITSAPLQEAAGMIVVPFEKSITTIGLWLTDINKSFQEKQDLIDQNEELKNTVDTLTEQNNILIQNQSELSRLQELYDLDAEYSDYPKVAARIISKDPGNWYDTFMINKGSKDGIRVDNKIVVDKAWNGKEAIDKFEESAPGTYDLILMDIMMPVMGGREAARRIRTLERPDAETVRIYAMTAQVSSESVHKCLASGMNGHIAKPIDESKLREILTRCESVKKQKD